MKKQLLLGAPYLGLRIGPLVRKLGLGRNIRPDALRGKILVVDALVTIYQMLATIRGPDGYFLTDSRGRITSHLVGIFNRECRLMGMGIRSIYVFDGPPHPLKRRILKERRREKEKFLGKFLEAVRRGNVDQAIKLGKRAMFVTDDMVREAKTLIKLLGIPIVQAPHDAEAQAAYIVSRGQAYALATRDWDAFLYGAPRIIMHWRITPDEYLPSRLYELEELLGAMGMDRRRLIDLAMLLGTDFNPGGFRGIGPKRAYGLIKTYGSVERLLELGKIKWTWDISPEDIRRVFLDPPRTDNYEISFGEPDVDGLLDFLVGEHNFSPRRVKEQIRSAIRGLRRLGEQTRIDLFMG